MYEELFKQDNSNAALSTDFTVRYRSVLHSHTSWKHTTGALCKLAVNKVSECDTYATMQQGWLMVMETLGDERGNSKYLSYAQAKQIQHASGNQRQWPRRLWPQSVQTATYSGKPANATAASDKQWVDTVKATPVQYKAI